MCADIMGRVLQTPQSPTIRGSAWHGSGCTSKRFHAADDKLSLIAGRLRPGIRLQVIGTRPVDMNAGRMFAHSGLGPHPTGNVHPVAG